MPAVDGEAGKKLQTVVLDHSRKMWVKGRKKGDQIIVFKKKRL